MSQRFLVDRLLMILGSLCLAIALLLFVTLQRVDARQLGLLPSGEDVRFQLIGNEPIAGPDGRTLVTGWSALVFKDRKSGRCYLAFKNDDGIAVQPGTTCPP